MKTATTADPLSYFRPAILLRYQCILLPFLFLRGGIMAAMTPGFPASSWLLAVAAVGYSLCAATAGFLLVALGFPSILAPLNRLWLRFGLLLHRIVSPLVLGIMFFLVITPMGLLMRAFGKDLLRLKFDRAAASYWIERTPPGPPPESMADQF